MTALRGLHYRVADPGLDAESHCGWDREPWPCREWLEGAWLDQLARDAFAPPVDEEPWSIELADPGAGVDLLDGAVVVTALWLHLTAITAAAFAVVLALLAWRKLR